MSAFNNVLVGAGGRAGCDALVLTNRLVGPEAHVTMADEGLARDLRKTAKKRRTDLLVVGSRGCGPIERLVPRGVLGHLAEHTACPLIVVPSAG